MVIGRFEFLYYDIGVIIIVGVKVCLRYWGRWGGFVSVVVDY